MRLEPHRLVFIDETAVTTKMTRLRGRSPRGTRLEADAPFGHWRTQTFIAGLRIDELSAPWVLDGPMNRAAFDIYIETQLACTLQPGDVVIADKPVVTQIGPRTRAAEVARQLAALSAALLTRSEPDRNGVLENQSTPATAALSTPSSNPYPRPATSSLLTSAETSSRLPDMLQIKWTML